MGIIISPYDDPAATKTAAERLRNETIKNGFIDMCNFGNPFGGNPAFTGYTPLAGFPPSGGSFEQIEDTTTLFTNLRWYMVSNFRQLLSELFVEIGLVQTICIVPVEDALRGGVMIKSQQLDEDQIRFIKNSMDRDDDLGTIKWAGVWERLYGGAGVLILIDDQDPEEPLNIRTISKATDMNFRAVDMWELFWDKQNTEGYDPQRQEATFEWYSYYSENVHKSRVLRLKGIVAPSFIRPRLRGWGVSVVETLVRSINQYLKATDVAFELLDENKIDVYKMKDLIGTLLTAQGAQNVRTRVAFANFQKNFQHAIVMDSEDDYDHKTLPFTGLAEAMAEIRMQVAADMRMPITKLFGTSVSHGFQTDQNDMENYNGMVEEIRGKLKYHILRIIELKCQREYQFIPDDLEIEFKPLRELSAVDQETVKTQKFTRITTAMDSGRISDKDYRDAINKGDLLDVKLDVTDGMAFSFEDQEVEDSAADDDDEIAKRTEDVDDPGIDRADTREVSLGTGVQHKLPSTSRTWTNIKPYPLHRRLFNSPEFDRKSYEADGGDSLFDPREKELFENPGNVDEALWSKAKRASEKAFGHIKWQFVTWFYKKQGGRFNKGGSR